MSKMNSPQSALHAFPQELGQEDYDILAYIGGAIVHKLQRRYTDKDKLKILEIFNSSKDEACNASFIKLKDRGGLNYLNDSACKFIEALETNFRSHISYGQVKMCQLDFLQLCKIEVSDAFLNCVSESNIKIRSDIVINVISDFVHLFNKIRIHHRFKVLIDQMKTKSNNKSLRKSLKK